MTLNLSFLLKILTWEIHLLIYVKSIVHKDGEGKEERDRVGNRDGKRKRQSFAY